MRAFLREPSTPWIVFDRDGRPPSQLAVGEMLSSPRRSLLSFADASTFFPATAIIDATPSATQEPSSLAVASDLEAADAKASVAGDADDDELAVPRSAPMFGGLGRRVVGAAAGTFALVATLAIGSLALRASADGAPARGASGQGSSRSLGSSVPAEALPPELDVRAPSTAPAPAAAAPAAAAVSVATRDTATPVKASAKKLARLSVTGDARSRDVFFDGKRMLGRGARTFTVLCGAHTVAVGHRADARDVEIPCTGSAELVIGK